MVSTFSPNLNIELVGRGDQVGVWDTPENADWSILDLAVGGIATISGAAGSVVLAAAQFQCKTLTFNSTLLASITVTLPTSFKKSYEIQNACTGSSQFVITLQTTSAGGQAICVPPGTTSECFNDGTNVKFNNLPYVGSYWDYAGSSVPNWVSGCTVPPWVNCDGTAVSSSVYPTLFGIIGPTLPDARGHFRLTLNQGTGRVTTANGGVDGNTVLAQGGSPNHTISVAELPAHSHGVTDPGHNHTTSPATPLVFAGVGAVGTAGGGSGIISMTIVNSVTGISIQNAGGGNGMLIMNPAYVGGITMIRAG